MILGFFFLQMDDANYILPTNIYLFKVSNRNIRKRCEICSELTIKIPERRQWRRSDVLLLNLNIFHTFFYFLGKMEKYPRENCPLLKKRILWSFLMLWNILRVKISSILTFVSLNFGGYNIRQWGNWEIKKLYSYHQYEIFM